MRWLIKLIMQDILGYRVPGFDPFNNPKHGKRVRDAAKNLPKAGSARNRDQRYFADRKSDTNVFRGKHKPGKYGQGDN